MFFGIPQYASYKLGVYDDNYKTAEASDIAWMIVRFFNRAPPSARTDLPDPKVPHSWEIPTDVEAIPVNQLLEKLVTLVTALDQLTRLNTLTSGLDKKRVVALDMDLYNRVLKVEHIHPHPPSIPGQTNWR